MRGELLALAGRVAGGRAAASCSRWHRGTRSVVELGYRGTRPGGGELRRGEDRGDRGDQSSAIAAAARPSSGGGRGLELGDRPGGRSGRRGWVVGIELVESSSLAIAAAGGTAAGQGDAHRG